MSRFLAVLFVLATVGVATIFMILGLLAYGAMVVCGRGA